MTDQSPDRPISFPRRLWSGWIKPLAVVLVIITTFRSAVADWNDVPTPSMEPTILVGDRIFVNKLAYDLKIPFTTRHIARWGDPARGDVITFYSPKDGKRLVKRVIGVPGDVIAMRANRVFINGKALTYRTASSTDIGSWSLTDPPPHAMQLEQVGQSLHPVMTQPNRGARRDVTAVKVPDGAYFVMGDNRDNSGDSRVFGFVDREAIAGRVVAVAVSFDYDNYFLPRMGRWFRAMP